MVVEKDELVKEVMKQVNDATRNEVIEIINEYINEALLYEFKKNGIKYLEYTKIGRKLQESGFFHKKANLKP